MDFNALPTIANEIQNAAQSSAQSKNELRNKASAALIEEIITYNDLDVLGKQELVERVIRNAQKLKWQNTKKIIEKTDNILKNRKTSLLKASEKVNTGWMLEFLDNCENTTDEDMKDIWAKILASECEKPGSVSKRLLWILRVIDKRTAENFGKICAHTLIYERSDGTSTHFIIPYLRDKSYDNKIIDDFILSLGFDSDGLTELQNLGLINHCYDGYVYHSKEMIINYYGNKLKVQNSYNDKIEIDLGQYQYSRYGLELANVLYADKECEKDNNYIDFLAEFLSVERKNIVEKL